MIAYEFGPMRLVPERHALSYRGEGVPLPPRLFLILLMLVENDCRVVSQEELRARVWPNSFVEDAAVSKNVSTLRAALRGCLGDVEAIRTLPKHGYQFLLPVVAITSENEAEGTQTPELSQLLRQAELRAEVPADPLPFFSNPDAVVVRSQRGRLMRRRCRARSRDNRCSDI